MSETIQASVRTAFANFIDGEWTRSRSGDGYQKRNPARPADLIGEFPLSNANDVRAAAAAALKAFPDWARAPASTRGGVLARAADALDARSEEIARDMTREMGKPLRHAREEVTASARTLRYFGTEWTGPQGEIYEQADTGGAVHALRRPLGVVGLITPWSSPAAIPARKVAPALACGNTVVLKLPQEAPLTGLHLTSCLREAGAPPGVLNVIVGRGTDAGAALVRHPAVGAISFTGSVEVSEGIREEAARRGKRVHLEVGGHNPLVVLADADLERAVEAAFAGAFWSAGQTCTATRRIFAEEGVYDEFRDALIERMQRAAVGDPADPATEVGPLVNESRLEDVLSAIARAQADGGVVAAGGEKLDGEGHLVAPTLFEDVGDDALLSRREIFGPVAALSRVSSLDEAIERANAAEPALVASIFTAALGSAQTFAARIQAGVIHVNTAPTGYDAHLPLGGTRSSLYRPQEHGKAALHLYTQVVSVYYGVVD